MSPKRPASKSKSFLSLGASEFSQSFAGTAIPPPDPAALPPPPDTRPSRDHNRPFRPQSQLIPRKPVPAPDSYPIDPSSAQNSRKNSLAAFGGPLSSHPITPVNSGSTEAFPTPDQSEMQTSPSTNGDHVMGNGHHDTGEESDSNNFDPSLSTQPSQEATRRPNFLSRFTKLRSSSFMRSKSQLGRFGESTNNLNNFGRSSLNHSSNGTRPPGTAGTMGPPERGVKRPASPAVAGPGSNTFPRMVRKKSMELLTTARRKSGMWTREDDMNKSAMDEERSREAAREAYLEDLQRPVTEERRRTQEMDRLEQQKQDEEARLDRQRRYEELMRTAPPPTIQLTTGLSSLDGEDMFRNIG